MEIPKIAKTKRKPKQEESPVQTPEIKEEPKQSAIERYKKAQAANCIEDALLGIISTSMQLEVNNRQPTCRTNGIRIQINESFIQQLDDAEIRFVDKHEALHVALLHNLRLSELIKSEELSVKIVQSLFDQAADYAINDLLTNIKSDKIKPPKNGMLYNPEFWNQTAEKIYEKLRERRKESPNGNDPSSDQPSGNDGADSGTGKSDQNQSGDAPGNDPGQHSDDVETQSQSENPGIGGVFVVEPLSENEVSQVIQTVERAAEIAKSRGELPGYMNEVLRKLYEIKIDWKQVLRSLFDEISQGEYGWTKTNRRFDEPMPSNRNPNSVQAIIAYDTSGSVSSESLEKFFAETQKCFNECDTKSIILIQCDSAISNVVTVNKGEEFPTVITGRGGTNFQPVFDYIEQESLMPKVVIFCTDGYGDRPTQPDYPVYWFVEDPSEANYIRTRIKWAQNIISMKEGE